MQILYLTQNSTKNGRYRPKGGSIAAGDTPVPRVGTEKEKEKEKGWRLYIISTNYRDTSTASPPASHMTPPTTFMVSFLLQHCRCLASPWWQFLLFSNSGVNIDINTDVSASGMTYRVRTPNITH